MRLRPPVQRRPDRLRRTTTSVHPGYARDLPRRTPRDARLRDARLHDARLHDVRLHDVPRHGPPGRDARVDDAPACDPQPGPRQRSYRQTAGAPAAPFAECWTFAAGWPTAAARRWKMDSIAA